MSIIQEALEKVGVGTKKREVSAAETLPPEPFKRAKPVRAMAAQGSIAQTESLRLVYIFTVVVLIVILAGIIIKASQSPALPVKNKITAFTLLPKIEAIPQPYKGRPAKNYRNLSNLGGFILDGIMYIADRPRAIINNIIVGEGEIVDGATVGKINKNNVVLNHNESEVTLKLNI